MLDPIECWPTGDYAVLENCHTAALTRTTTRFTSRSCGCVERSSEVARPGYANARRRWPHGADRASTLVNCGCDAQNVMSMQIRLTRNEAPRDS